MLTTNYTPGVPVWVDLGTPDVAAASAFYGALFGWRFQSSGPDAGGYGMLTLNGKIVAGIGPLNEQNATTSWTVFFHTLDAGSIATAVKKSGGKIRFAPFDVFTQGRTGGFTDPTGAQFAIWQPGDTLGLDAVATPGSLCWTELYTTDPTAAKTFYTSVFGWSTDDMPIDGLPYAVIRPSGGDQRTVQGGIMGMGKDVVKAGITSRWQPYFEVSDCDVAVTTATERGGTIMMSPSTMGDMGRMALLVDPFGAPFAVIASTPR